jgi:hypothetical protein
MNNSSSNQRHETLLWLTEQAALTATTMSVNTNNFPSDHGMPVENFGKSALLTGNVRQLGQAGGPRVTFGPRRLAAGPEELSVCYYLLESHKEN